MESNTIRKSRTIWPRSSSLKVDFPTQMKRRQPDILVLGPGGIKGFFLVGALMYFENTHPQWLTGLKKICGVSIGAIIGLLLTAGFSMTEIIREALEIDLFRDLTSLKFKDFEGVSNRLGLLSNEPIKELLTAKLKEKFGKVPTLYQLYQATGIEFSSVAVNLTEDRAEHFTVETHPRLSCIDAVLRSMNIPLAFYRLEEDDAVYVDGAFGNCHPVDYFDDGVTSILAIAVESTTATAGNKTVTIVDLLLDLYKCINRSFKSLREHNIKNSSSACQHLILTSKEMMDPLGLGTSDSKKAGMIVQGYQQTAEWMSEGVSKMKVE